MLARRSLRGLMGAARSLPHPPLPSANSSSSCCQNRRGLHSYGPPISHYSQQSYPHEYDQSKHMRYGPCRQRSRPLCSAGHRRHHHELSGSRSLPVWFVRGGTSNGLVIKRADLPADEILWGEILPAVMGSPDPYGRQLDGLGSGVSSTSKVAVLGPASRPDVDVDFTFVQVGIKEGSLDMAGNCGNMSSVVGPAAWDMGMIAASRKRRAVEREAGADSAHEGDSGWATVRFLNTNTSKVMEARFKVIAATAETINKPGEELSYLYCPSGDYEMDGVAGKSSPITLSFLDPAGAKTRKGALPTGNPVDLIELPNGEKVEVSLVDVGNPGVFVSTASLGLDQGIFSSSAVLTPAAVEADSKLKNRLQEIRRAGAARMGLDPDVESVPKVVMVYPSSDPDVDIRCLAMSMGQAHKAVPLTLSLCLGAACQLEGTIANAMLAPGRDLTSSVSIGHPGGKVNVQTVIREGRIESAQLFRTARVLMKGLAYY